MSSRDLEIDGLARWLVRHAARRVPQPLAERLEEEWLGDLTAHDGRVSRLRFGFGCCWAATVILHEQCGASAAAAAGSTTGQTTMTYYSHRDPPLFTLRTLALVLIACLHVILIYALASGLGIGKRMTEVTPSPVAGHFLPAAPEPLPPAPPPPTLTSWRVDAPPLPPPPQFPPDNAMSEIVEGPSPAHALPLPPAPVDRVVGGPGRGFPDTAEYYPPASRRLAETGTAAVRVCVDRTGRLTTLPVIAQSSGSRRLDESAMRLSLAGSGHYRPTTEDGRPVDSCYLFRVRFVMRE